MKTRAIFNLLVSVMTITLTPLSFARGGGGGGQVGGGHFGGGFHGGGFHGGGFRSGARYSFGVRPTFGRPVVMRPQTQVAASRASGPVFTRQRSYYPENDNRIATARSTSARVAPNSATRPSELARNHVYARANANEHHDWDRRSAHFWNGRWWAWDDGAWLGLEAGYYPWDYYPYYAYDYYPYDYYPGYYSDVEPYYNTGGVSDTVPAPDSTVTAVQQDLANLGYYKGPVDGLYGRQTRDAVARYQSNQKLAVTGTLTMQTLRSLGVAAQQAAS